MHLIFPRWMILLLAVAVLSPWPVIVFLVASGHAVNRHSKVSVAAATPDAAADADAKPSDPPPQEWIAGKKGPWGQIESMVFDIDAPEEAVVVPAADQPPVRWSFPGYSKEKVLATLRAAGLAEDEVGKLGSSARWNSADGVTWLEPGDALILGLAPQVRSKLYAVLVEFPQNAQTIDPIWFQADNVDWRLQDCGLAAESVALLKRLLYPQGENRLLFTDLEPALRSLPSDAERKRFMKLVLRKRAVLARVRLDPDTDVEDLSQYWGIGGRRKDIYPFLSALHRVEKGCKINVVCLLPDFPRDHLYRHPSLAAAGKSLNQDCFWSAYNFFNDPPDDNVEDTHSLVGLNKGYYRILAPTQLGDLMILAGRDGVPIHAAVFLADDIYFTKNGINLTQPWILMHLADLLENYNVRYPSSGPLNIHYFRRKGL